MLPIMIIPQILREMCQVVLTNFRALLIEHLATGSRSAMYTSMYTSSNIQNQLITVPSYTASH